MHSVYLNFPLLARAEIRNTFSLVLKNSWNEITNGGRKSKQGKKNVRKAEQKTIEECDNCRTMSNAIGKIKKHRRKKHENVGGNKMHEESHLH